jgi:monofunctional biosynthetic peptidoglycan transglycosylase
MLGVGAAVGLVFVGVQWLTWPEVTGLAERPPERTAYMDAYRAGRRAAGEDTTVAWRWAEWDRISVHLKRAVVAAEDMEFFSHAGFSKSEMEVALRDALAGERFRGASTITQQLAKNLYFGTDRSLFRKAMEVAVARRLERRLGKDRILELYLNVVEWGPGIFGAEAASRHYFGRSASDLTLSQAAALAATLPHPLTSNPALSPGRMQWRQALILERLDLSSGAPQQGAIPLPDPALVLPDTSLALPSPTLILPSPSGLPPDSGGARTDTSGLRDDP